MIYRDETVEEIGLGEQVKQFSVSKMTDGWSNLNLMDIATLTSQIPYQKITGILHCFDSLKELVEKRSKQYYETLALLEANNATETEIQQYQIAYDPDLISIDDIKSAISKEFGSEVANRVDYESTRVDDFIISIMEALDINCSPYKVMLEKITKELK